MDLQPSVDRVRRHLELAAALGDDQTREVAAALAAAVQPAVELALVSAVSAMAEEIATALRDATGAPAVTARVAEGEVHFSIRYEQDAPSPPEDPDTSARISLRLSETLKAEIEAAAQAERLSVNTWVVRAAATAVARRRRHRDSRHSDHEGHNISGWVNGS